MILAKNKKTGIEMTFDSQEMFEIANMFSGGEFEIVNKKHTPENHLTIVPEFLSEKKFSADDFNFDEVHDMIDVFSVEELKILSEDKRKTIANLAKKQLNKLKK